MELAQEYELVEHFHFFIEATLFWQIADALERLHESKGLPKRRTDAGVWPGDADHHADGA